MYKYLLFFLIVTNLIATPNWYYNLSNNNSNIYIGYGSANNENEAKQNALKDISSQISINIDSTTKQNKKLNNGKYTKEISISSTQTTKITLEGYDLINISKEDNIYYIAISYENIPSIDKFINKLKNLKLTDEPQDKFTKLSLLNNYIKTKINKNINFKLIRKDEKWYIKYKNVMQILDKKDFSKFFTTIINNNLSIETNKKNNILYDEDEFYFKVKSSKQGYVSILTILMLR